MSLFLTYSSSRLTDDWQTFKGQMRRRSTAVNFHATDNVGSSLGRSRVLRLLRDVVRITLVVRWDVVESFDFSGTSSIANFLYAFLPVDDMFAPCLSFIWWCRSVVFPWIAQMILRESLTQSIGLSDNSLQVVLRPYPRPSVTAPITTVHRTSVAKYICLVWNITNQLGCKIIWFVLMADDAYH